jgi:hypothetical protein
MPLVLALLLLCACSSGSEYRRGTHVRPPSFHPAQDAPHTVGQPGHLQPRTDYPRSPHTRVLPQTPGTARQPGLWAGGGDVTVIDPKEITVLGVELLLPPEMYDGEAGDAGPTILCAKHWNAVLATDAAKWLREMKDDAARRCLVALMNEACVDLPELVHEGIDKPAGIVSLEMRRRHPEMKRRAEAFTDMMCRDVRTAGFYIARFKNLVEQYQDTAVRDMLGRSNDR